MCHQSVGLIARQVEAAGMTTLCMTSALDITRSVNPPRAAFLDYPLGHTSGEPHQPALQSAIMRQACAAFALQTPGSIKMLPFQWSAGEAWKHTAQRGPGDDRLPRYNTPQYQNDDDRRHAEANHSAACVMCPSEAVLRLP